MGGILLICSLIAIYLVVYWSIHIELLGDKTKGFLGIIPSASDNLHANRKEKKHFLSSLKPIDNKKLDIKKSINKRDNPKLIETNKIDKEKKPLPLKKRFLKK